MLTTPLIYHPHTSLTWFHEIHGTHGHRRSVQLKSEEYYIFPKGVDIFHEFSEKK